MKGQLNSTAGAAIASRAILWSGCLPASRLQPWVVRLKYCLCDSSTYNTVEERILYSYSICCFYVCFKVNQLQVGELVLFCLCVCVKKFGSCIPIFCVCVCVLKGGYLEFTVSVRLV